MPMSWNDDDLDRVRQKLTDFFVDTSSDLKFIGSMAAGGIVGATLSGKGENDTDFKPYSPAYKEQISAVGGKPQGDRVNLRGVFYPPGSGPKPRKTQKAWEKQDRSLRKKGAGRRAYITITRGGKTFQVKTAATRPALGLTDPLSEMSLDLIKIEATDQRLTITYSPRKSRHMIIHQTGEGKMPKRTWFTLNRKNVIALVKEKVVHLFKARVAWFNNHLNSGKPPQDNHGSGH